MYHENNVYMVPLTGQTSSSVFGKHAGGRSGAGGKIEWEVGGPV